MRWRRETWGRHNAVTLGSFLSHAPHRRLTVRRRPTASPAPHSRTGVMPCGLSNPRDRLTFALGAALLGFVASSTVFRIDILARQA